MSPGRPIRRGRARLALAVALLSALVLLGLRAGEVRAAACDTSWTGNGADSSWFTAGNWSGGVPTASTNACINKPGTYAVLISGQTATAQSLELGVGTASGVQTLQIEGTNDGSAHEGELDLTGGGLIGSTGRMLLTASCSTGGCTTGAPAALTIAGATPLVNQGTLTVAPGSDGGSSGRAISGDLTNQGTVEVDAALTYASGLLDNQGTISLADGQTLTLPCCQMPSLTNDSGGQITNGGGTGHVAVKAKATFTQGGGTTNPAGPSPANPAVIVDNSAFIAGPPTLSYTGAGASTIEARGTVALTGNLASGQNLVINAVAGCPGQSLVTAASSFTNAGAITLAGACDSGLKVSGTLTNTGTLTAAATGSGITREIKGSLANAGALNINGATAFDAAGATLAQTGGTTTLSPGAIFDTSASGATFNLQGGVLEGGGQTTPTQAYVGGPVNNSGGNVIPGSAGSPGLMTVGGTYTQGSGGKLTVVVRGSGGPSGRGSHYSQLASTGPAVLGGTLAISTAADPSLGDLDTIFVTNGGVSGTFATVTGTFPPSASFGYQTTYGSNYAALTSGRSCA